MSYFKLNGAYNDVQLKNSPSQYQDLRYPCFVQYPPSSSATTTTTTQVRTQNSSMSHGVKIPSTTSLKKDYKTIDQTYLFNVKNPAY
jgi:hypothetical protein